MTKLNLNRRSLIKAGGAAAVMTAMPLAARASTVLKLSHPFGESHPVYPAAEMFKSKVEERTGGELAITIFPQNALGSTNETARQTQLGAIDLVIMNPPNIETQAPEAGVVQIPYQFDGYAHAYRTLNETANPWLRQLLADNGLHWVANYVSGFRSLSNSVRPVRSPDDIAGMNLRVPPELSIKATFEALRANTQTISFTELYLALAGNVVDGQDNPVSVTYANKFFEVQKYIATTNHIFTPLMMAANPRAWSRLSEAQQQILTEESQAAGLWAQDEVVKGDEAILKTLQEAGLEITRPDPAPFREMMDPAWAVLRERIGTPAWDTWMDFVEAARGA